MCNVVYFAVVPTVNFWTHPTAFNSQTYSYFCAAQWFITLHGLTARRTAYVAVRPSVRHTMRAASCQFSVLSTLTVLHWMQGGLVRRKLSICPSVRPSVCLSVCVSVKRVHCDKMEERSVQIFLYHTKDHLASVSEKKNG